LNIRSTAKALISANEKILLIKNNCDQIGDFYCLPGGGQNKYETLAEAVIRECKEETGYDVKPLKLVGLCEEICLNENVRENNSEYAHKVYHIFSCELVGDKVDSPVEEDVGQVCCEWVDFDALGGIKLLPKCLAEQIVDVLSGVAPVFLGSDFTHSNNG